jgi:CubicO group peptidase (beta-lactamase class C family)
VPETPFRVAFDAAKIDAIFADLDQCHLPGAVVGIAIRGRPVYRKGFGLANMEQPIVLSPTIRMRIGSASKHFAALGFLLLCEEGRARVDDPIGKYLPELHASAQHVTMRQLMCNVSGLRDVFDVTWQFSGTLRPTSSAELLSMYRDIDDANSPPGERWIYNNGGYLMLSVAIERIAGVSLEDFLRARIFEPLFMYSTELRRSETGFVANAAALHMKNAAGAYERSNYYGTAFAGEGGVLSTVDDMLRWLIHMDAPIVGSRDTWKLMQTPHELANGSSSGYGFGLLIDRYRGLPIIHHPGGGMGANAQILKAPAAGLDVVVIVNRDESAMLLTNRIVDACVQGLEEVGESAPAVLATGTFHSARTGRVVQLFEQGQKQVASIDGKDTLMAPDLDGVLWPAGTSSYAKQALTIVGDPRTPAAIRLSDFGNDDELVRRDPPSRPDVRAIAGAFRSAATGTEATIREIDGVATLTTIGRFGSRAYPLECIAERIWRAQRSTVSPPTGGILVFDRDGGGFRFSSYRTLALPFARVGS